MGWYDIVFNPFGFIFTYGHIGYAWGLYRLFTGQLMISTWIICIAVFGLWTGLAVTIGVHRLWTHRAYKARWPLRVFLMIGESMGDYSSIHDWVFTHRVHHKGSDTDADPHNVLRGFTFAHLGWFVKRQHPLVDIESKKIDCKDIHDDPVAEFQHRHFEALRILFAFVFPVALTYYITGDSLLNCILIAYFHRLMNNFHSTGFINSASHLFGDRPYNNKIQSAENHPAAWFAFGEGYHNYHHAYPFDYGIGESGNSTGKWFIDVMRVLGQAYDCKRVTPEMLEQSKERAKLKICEFNTDYL
jgi:stearoyl-CoA desaturase (delta-9 desaturase)